MSFDEDEGGVCSEGPICDVCGERCEECFRWYMDGELNEDGLCGECEFREPER